MCREKGRCTYTEELGSERETRLKTEIDVGSTDDTAKSTTDNHSSEGELVSLLDLVRIDGERLGAREQGERLLEVWLVLTLTHRGRRGEPSRRLGHHRPPSRSRRASHLSMSLPCAPWAWLARRRTGLR